MIPAAGGGDQSTCLFADAAHAEGGCNTEPCGEAVECIGSWGTWGACDASCGGGVQRRPYTIERHAANGGGLADCVSSADRTEERACNTEPCPADCVGSWGEWLGCEHVCEAAFHRLWPWVDSLNATTPGVKKGRIVDLPGQARAMIAKKKKED